MPLAGVAASFRAPRTGPIGKIGQGRSFNHFPAIIAAFPKELSAIVTETTDDLGILSASLAPVQANPRKGDPAPGTLKGSEKTKVFYRGSGDSVVTGRVDFMAKTPSGHRYAHPVETGSIRRGGHRGRNNPTGSATLTKVKAEPFLVPAIVELRPVFIERLSGLEGRLPR
ncbi:MAG: hypothetical protein ACYDCI_05785 [Candidatus Limnocylindrales bacterium]